MIVERRFTPPPEPVEPSDVLEMRPCSLLELEAGRCKWPARPDRQDLQRGSAVPSSSQAVAGSIARIICRSRGASDISPVADRLTSLNAWRIVCEDDGEPRCPGDQRDRI